MKPQLRSCTPSPAICGWYQPGLPPSCLGSSGYQTRRFARGWVSLALLQPSLVPYRQQFQWQLDRLKEGGATDRGEQE